MKPVHISASIIGVAMVALGFIPRPSRPPPLCNHDAFHQELAAQSARLEKLETHVPRVAMLAAFGGAKMRGPKSLRVITCDGAAFLDGSHGQMAWSALWETGLCSPAEDLPGPEAHR